MNITFQNHRLLLVLLSFCSCFTLSSCGEPPVSRINLKIALVDSLTVEDKDGSKRLSEKTQELCAGLEANNTGCEHMYVFDPIMLRLDLNKEFSLKTIIAKGVARKTTHPKVITKLVKKNLEEIDVPSNFTKRFVPGKEANLLLREFVSTKAKNDTILVLSENGALEKYILNNKQYRVFDNVEELRKHMLSVLCQNDKISFALLINPPEPSEKLDSPPVVAVPPKPSALSENPIVVADPKKISKKPKGPKVSVPTSPRPISFRDGICDRTTHTLYERLEDNNGREIRGKVLVTNCAQCGYQGSRGAASYNTEQWISDPVSPERCENGVLYRYEKNTRTGESRRTRTGTCSRETR